MRTTIDAAGRIVVPKEIREELGLNGGQEVELSTRDGKIEIELPSSRVRLERRGRHLVAVPKRRVPELTAQMVRDTLENVRT